MTVYFRYRRVSTMIGWMYLVPIPHIGVLVALVRHPSAIVEICFALVLHKPNTYHFTGTIKRIHLLTYNFIGWLV